MTRRRRHCIGVLVVQLVGVILVLYCILENKVVFEGDRDLEKYETVDDVISEVTKLDIVKKIDDWPHGIKFAVWNKVDENIPKTFDEGWLDTIDRLIEPGCNIVDIGGNTGDTPLVLAVAAKGGTVVAFEMGPPIHLLRINKR